MSQGSVGRTEAALAIPDGSPNVPPALGALQAGFGMQDAGCGRHEGSLRERGCSTREHAGGFRSSHGLLGMSSTRPRLWVRSSVTTLPLESPAEGLHPSVSARSRPRQSTRVEGHSAVFLLCSINLASCSRPVVLIFPRPRAVLVSWNIKFDEP